MDINEILSFCQRPNGIEGFSRETQAKLSSLARYEKNWNWLPGYPSSLWINKALQKMGTNLYCPLPSKQACLMTSVSYSKWAWSYLLILLCYHKAKIVPYLFQWPFFFFCVNSKCISWKSGLLVLLNSIMLFRFIKKIPVTERIHFHPIFSIFSQWT